MQGENFQEILQAEIVPWLATSGLKVAVIIVVGWIIARIFHRVVARIVRKLVTSDSDTDPRAELRREETLIQVFSGTFRVVIWFIVAFMVISEFNIDIGPLLAGAGIVGVAVGFGAQYLVRDIISGFFILLENQYRVGDVVCLDDTCGTIEHISLRTTILRDIQGAVHYVQNGSFEVATNQTKDISKVVVDVGVGYHTDLSSLAELINDVGSKLASDPEWGTKIINAPEFVRVLDFSDSSITVRVSGVVEPKTQWEVEGELRKRLKTAFDEAGIEIPFPQRVVHHMGSSLSSEDVMDSGGAA